MRGCTQTARASSMRLTSSSMPVRGESFKRRGEVSGHYDPAWLKESWISWRNSLPKCLTGLPLKTGHYKLDIAK